MDGGYDAFDDEDLEVDPIRLTGVDLVQWTLDLEAFAAVVQEANGLSGKPEELESRLWFLGSKERDGTPAAYLLGLLDGSAATLTLLESLPVRLGYKYQSLVVACPSHTPQLEETRRLNASGISLTRFDSEQPFAFSSSAISIPPSRQGLNRSEFVHSEDYRWVKWRGQEFNLGPMQAEVVRVLHRAYRSNRSGLTWDAIQPQLSGNANRMSEIFRKADLRTQLVLRETPGSIYRLNL